MDVIVDDHLLLQVLLNEEPADLRAPGAQIFTTGLWYHRLCRAVSSEAVTGALSRRLGGADRSIASFSGPRNRDTPGDHRTRVAS